MNSYRWLWASTSVFARYWHSLVWEAITGSLQQNLSGICNSVWVWWLILGWIPSLWIVHPFVLAPNFVSVTPFMGILFPILRRNEVSTHWSSLFLIFLCFANCILGVLCCLNEYRVWGLNRFLVPFCPQLVMNASSDRVPITKLSSLNWIVTYPCKEGAYRI